VSERDRAVAFLLETYKRRVEHVERFPWGQLLVTPSLPRVWDANFAIVGEWDGTVAEMQREMSRLQAERGFLHRKVVLPDEELAARVWTELPLADWEFANRFLIMAQQRAPDRPAEQAIEVLGIGEVDWAHGRQEMITGGYGGGDVELARQLIELDRRLADAMDVRHYAAYVEGEVAAYAALYLEGGIAQIEDVATLPGHRGQGLARAVVLQAVAEASRAGADLVFLVADEADWPQEFYGRLGFDVIGVEHMVGRPGRHDSRS
jgi:ribosomal protein S18 acetylase RimI-like enzyme